MRNPFITSLHQLQTVNYNLRLFLTTIIQHPSQLRTGATRQQLVRTTKTRILFLGAWVCYGCILYVLLTYRDITRWGILLAILFLLFLFPLYLVLIAALIQPVQAVYMHWYIHQAAKKLTKRKQTKPLTIIGIVGSFGKTSQKEILTHLLSSSYKVLCTEDNKNTLYSVAKLILEKLTDHHEVFIVEMGEDHRGDIRKLCSLVQPDIGIITGITRQHMDTFGTYDAVIRTIAELFDSIKDSGTIYLHQPFEDLRQWYHDKNNCIVIDSPTDITYLDQFAGITFTYKNHHCTSPLLAKHSVYPLITAREIAKNLGKEENTIIERISTLPYVPHRLQPRFNTQTNITVIDDTYNGNIEGFKSGMDLLRNAKTTGRKWYITPGLIGTGNEEKAIHYSLGELLATSAESVILIDNEQTKALKRGLIAKGFDEQNIHTFPTTLLAHAALKKLLASGDVIMFQNDIPDLLI